MCSCNRLGTDEQVDSFNSLLSAHQNKNDEIMVVLQKTQDILGYIPKETVKMISDSLKIAESDISEEQQKAVSEMLGRADDCVHIAEHCLKIRETAEDMSAKGKGLTMAGKREFEILGRKNAANAKPAEENRDTPYGRYPDAEEFVIIDDIQFGWQDLDGKVVKTNFRIGRGLEERHVLAAIGILNDDQN